MSHTLTSPLVTLLRQLIFVSMLASLLLIAGCEKPQQAEPEVVAEEVEQEVEPVVEEEPTLSAIESGKDYHSNANPEQVVIEHLSLDLDLNFRKKVISGTVTLDLKRIDPEASQLILDTRDLTINSVKAEVPVEVLAEGEIAEAEVVEVKLETKELGFTLGENDPSLGAALSIELPDGVNQVTINYATSPEASGVQWLTPAQTAGGKQPFLFTQAQATHARSFIPLQDTPKVRVTYDAKIKTPRRMRAVMSAANNPNADRDGEYEFNMPQPIPSYLIALAAGDLEFKAMGRRTGVYAEKYILDQAAAEFEDTESMLETTEELYGPYGWDRYDLLILPPSFPFGGMENPRLSFITPTVIAGDKSLVALIAHELAHSWSGNTVTNATWRDLWLNEGFTTYLTYRIMEIVFGEDRYNMEMVLGYQDLLADIESLDDQDEILAIDLRGRDPDDVFSNIPYEKGALFLRELELRVGRENFDAFLKDYFRDYAFKSITTEEFLEYLNRTLVAKYPGNLSINRIHKWIFEPGIPVNAPVPESQAFTNIDTSRTAWLNSEIEASAIDTENWTVHEWLYFLNNMPDALTAEQMEALDSSFELTQSKNNEIAHSWLLMSIKNWYQPALPRLKEYLTSIGRNKLVKPLYRELAKTEEGKALGKAAFEKAKPSYHPLTVKANQEFVE